MTSENVTVSQASGSKGKRLPAWERALGVCFFALLVMMMGNMAVLLLVWQYNDTACRAAVTAAGEAVLEGKDTRAVMNEALSGLNKSAPAGIFVEPPMFTQFKVENTKRGEALRIETTALARVPAPFLMPNANFEHDGRVPMSRSYIFELGHPSGF